MQDWSHVAEELARRLDSLEPGQVLVLSEVAPAEPADGRRRGLFGRARRTPAPPVRYVQVAAEDEAWVLECVGAAYYPVTGDQHARLTELGWTAPEDWPAAAGIGQENYRVDVPAGAVEQTSTLLTASLAALGLTPAGPWEWTGDV